MIALALPTNRGLKGKTLQSLLEIVAKRPMDIIIGVEGFNTAENRTWMTVKAVKNGCSHIFFVDDDMVYEPDTVDKLLAHDKDIVGAKYYNRRGTGEVVEYSDTPNDTLFKVNALGGGCVLVKADVFKKITQPWFWYKILSTGAVSMSHDWYFCEKARQVGYDIWCDPTVKPLHITEKEF